ncbi:Nif3-like dinuclear metal center hexameric protein [Oceanobacillus halophilus]|uniref:GTP cyclohydrolase 1 type 2 homolog n=1 Tax=Oceanobacillus halophilus TaxID=930130 RepID=A0A495ACW1_9BACI|nr:Nif3-like dinuclear metal center hexameric protein [Oceanobacillus halophilus]RKQ37809.1 Nif3-like dinuclear metal center hexameric protein [Oceanobacillus halophilus]
MKNSCTNSDIFKMMERWAPKSLAYDWDNVGLQVGSYNNKVKKIMVTLDVLESVVDEAIQKKVDLIIAHHPLLFKPMKEVNFDTPKGKVIRKLIENQITVYAAHTNLDIAAGGVNDMICRSLGINESNILIESSSLKLYKLAVYVPKTHVETVRNGLSESGAGHIGNYSHCTFQTEGQGTFKPLEGTEPFIGEKGKLEYVAEQRIETIVPENRLELVIKAMLAAHPYEEPAYDIYPLINSGEKFGLGRVGILQEKMKLEDFCEHVKNAFDMESVRVTGDLNKKVSRVAILGGSGEKYIHQAKHKGADVYITGDMSFHMAQDAWQMGLAVIDAGHYIEKVMKEATATYLKDTLEEESLDIIVSDTNTDPFQFI